MKINIQIVTFVLLIIVIYGCYIITHENIHKQISIYHGCIEPVISYSLPTPYFKCIEYTTRTQETQLQERFLHSLNEIFGYVAIYFIFIALAFLGVKK